MSFSDIRDGKFNSLVYLALILGGVIALGFLKNAFGDGLLSGNGIHIFKHILTFDANEDSWFPMYRAAFEKVNNPELNLYQATFFESKIKFQYPPVSLIPFMALISMGFSWSGILFYINIISFVSLFGIAACVYVVAIIASGFYSNRLEKSIGLKILLFLIILIGTFFFYPILRAQYLGQIQVFLDLLISLVFVAWLLNKKLFAGVLIALAALVKPQFGLLLLWAILRKESRFCAGMFLVLIPATIVSIIVFGFRDHLDYLSVLSYIGEHGEVYYANQSINGILNRLLSDVSSLTWTYSSYAPYNIYVYTSTLLSTCGFLLFGLLYRPKWVRATGTDSDPVMSALDMSTMIILITIASPVAWEHHYGVFWPIIVLSLIMVVNIVKVRPDRTARTCLVLFVLGYYLIASHFDSTMQESFGKAPLSLLQSYNFLGGILLLASVVILRNLMKPLSSPATMPEELLERNDGGARARQSVRF